ISVRSATVQALLTSADLEIVDSRLTPGPDIVVSSIRQYCFDLSIVFRLTSLACPCCHSTYFLSRVQPPPSKHGSFGIPVKTKSSLVSVALSGQWRGKPNEHMK
ncbi:hypothetical protein BgiBS90_018703, partial [Biomphalaria glabrata]